MIASTSAFFNARSASSASASRCSSSRIRVFGLLYCPGDMLSVRWRIGLGNWRQVQACQNTFFVGHIPDNSPYGPREHLDQGGNDHDLLLPHLFRMLINIDDRQFVAAVEPLFADCPEIPDGI